ncbi:uncharacterized protein [Palaemon carinicauda]|uniref:uncharacterized protein n=1 Tax=Palaemon carinicauda TaxID=392227 RepID=UPI0035B5F5D3
MDGSSLRSRSHKSRRSVKSTASSVKSSLIQEKAKLAGLLAQRALLEKQTEIAQQQAELKAKEDLLKLDGEIEAARAREKVFQEEVIPSKDKVLNPETPAFVPSHNVHQNKPNVTMPFLPMAPAPESFYQSQQQLAAAMMLPHAEVTKFCGDLLEYASFMLAFNDRIVPHTTSDSNRLYFLNQHLEGKPKSLIAGCMFMNASEGYIEAKRLLDKVYGDPYKVSMAYIDKLTKWPQVRGDNSESLQEYALYLVKCNHTMQSLSNMQVLNDSPNLQRVISKLPVYIQNKWLDHVIKLRKQVTVQPSNSANQYTRKCQLCSGHHDLEECPQFLHRSVDERREFVKVNRLCFSCLGNNHTSKRCLNRRQCKTCNKRHPTTLHIENFRMLDSNSAIVSQASAQSESTGQGCAKGQDGTQGEGRTPGQGNTQTLSNLPMPFRDRNVNLPNNKKQAVSRAKWQRRKMKNSEDYRQQYTAFMDKLFEKGYAYKIPDDEVNKIPVWYLPHHAVFHPKKGKIRVVFDCSAKFEGVSLNDVLLQGPNLTNSLTGVLIRFRQEVYAFIGDIEAMFFQIKIPPENQDYVRFLWWPNALPAEDCSVESDKFNLDMESLMTRALGMLWDLKEDSFKFSIELKDNPFTRRGLLSTISSLYYPLGLLSPIILPAKKLLQELCQVESLDWDERIPDEPAERWEHWIQGLHLLEQLSIPRCFKSSGFGNVTDSSLVLFSDASTVGYGVAAYLVLHGGNQVQSNLVMGKSRVSPKKVVTIPRLELTAATVSVKVAQHILKELEFTVGKTRQKWNEARRNLIVGDVVLVKSDIEPRNHWPMGRVIEVYPDDKGTIRSGKIKTLSSVIVRPIQKLVLLVEG